MKTLIFCTATVFIFFGCQTPLNIEGTYSSRKDLNKFELCLDSTFLYTSLCYKGSSFVNKYSEGKWSRIDKNTVVINSRITDNIIPLQVERVNTSDSIIQICQNLVISQKRNQYKYKNEDFLVTPYIEENNYLELHPELSDEPIQITKNEFLISLGFEPDTINSSEVAMVCHPVKRGSYCIYPEKPFSNIYFEIEKRPKTVECRTFYRLRTEKVNIPVQLGDLLSINIALNDFLFSYRIFDNEKIKLSGSKLIFKDKEDNNKKNKLYIKN
ncbi:MAG: hypothetical protein FWF52_04410 [Candidatus Azobacteroides sp.]|nr:hypothetical protein [Candidatus Azobacteroides sp.]